MEYYFELLENQTLKYKVLIAEDLFDALDILHQ